MIEKSEKILGEYFIKYSISSDLSSLRKLLIDFKESGGTRAAAFNAARRAKIKANMDIFPWQWAALDELILEIYS